jgi:hypothetical protein
MNIIILEPNESGGRPPIQSWDGATPPEGYAEVACDTATFYMFRGFVTLTVEGGKVTAMEGNQAALNAYLALYPDPEPTEPLPTAEERLAALEAAMLEMILGGAT